MNKLAESKKAAAQKDSNIFTDWYYKRNKDMKQPATLQEARDTWILRSPDESIFHRQGAGNDNNLVFDAPDGHGEVVFRPDGSLVTDPRNMASYNLARKEDWLGHVTKDIIPYVLYGNSPDDPSTPGERLILTMDGLKKWGIKGLGKLDKRDIREIERMIKGKMEFKSRKEGAIAVGVRGLSVRPPFSRNRK